MKMIIPAVMAASLMTSTAVLAQTTTPGQAPAEQTPTTPGQAPAVKTTPTTPATPPAATPTAPPSTSASAGGPTLTEAEAKAWIDKRVYSQDDKNVGDVAAVQRDASGKVTEIHADVGGFLGIGTTRIRIEPSQFKLQGDRVVLTVPGDQVKSLPKVDRTKSK